MECNVVQVASAQTSYKRIQHLDGLEECSWQRSQPHYNACYNQWTPLRTSKMCWRPPTSVWKNHKIMHLWNHLKHEYCPWNMAPAFSIWVIHSCFLYFILCFSRELVEQAVQSRDTLERLLLISAFACASYYGSIHREAKPFNPILGETYEYKDNNSWFLAEQARICL